MSGAPGGGYHLRAADPPPVGYSPSASREPENHPAPAGVSRRWTALEPT